MQFESNLNQPEKLNFIQFLFYKTLKTFIKCKLLTELIVKDHLENVHSVLCDTVCE